MKIPAGEFKAKCLKVMDEVNQLGIEVIITKFGRPVAKLVPIRDEEKPELFGCLKELTFIKGDIVQPIEDEWESNA